MRCPLRRPVAGLMRAGLWKRYDRVKEFDPVCAGNGDYIKYYMIYEKYTPDMFAYHGCHKFHMDWGPQVGRERIGILVHARMASFPVTLILPQRRCIHDVESNEIAVRERPIRLNADANVETPRHLRHLLVYEDITFYELATQVGHARRSTSTSRRRKRRGNGARGRKESDMSRWPHETRWFFRERIQSE